MDGAKIGEEDIGFVSGAVLAMHQQYIFESTRFLRVGVHREAHHLCRVF